jgi:hypothetical protein
MSCLSVTLVAVNRPPTGGTNHGRLPEIFLFTDATSNSGRNAGACGRAVAKEKRRLVIAMSVRIARYVQVQLGMIEPERSVLSLKVIVLCDYACEVGISVSSLLEGQVPEQVTDIPGCSILRSNRMFSGARVAAYSVWKITECGGKSCSSESHQRNG